MRRWLTAAFVAVTAIVGAGTASAQEQAAGASRWEITGFPGGGILFTDGSGDSGEPDFGDYALGGSLTYNFNRYFGIEGEVGGGLGIDQRIDFAGGSVGDVSPPDMLAYNGNAIFYPFRGDRRFMPYVTGGVGGLTMFQQDDVAFGADETFLTGNAGAGVKVYFGHWGVRGDYRFLAIDSKDDAPAFFGRENRYGHRIYGGIIFGLGR